MKTWRMMWLGAWLAAACGAAQAQAIDEHLQGKVLYGTLASMGAGHEVAPDGPEARQVKSYLAFIAGRFNISEGEAGRTASAGLNMLRPHVRDTNLFEILDAAQRIAPAERGHDRNALVHVLTTYIGARSQRRDSRHEEAIRQSMAVIAAGSPGGAAPPAAR